MTSSCTTSCFTSLVTMIVMIFMMMTITPSSAFSSINITTPKHACVHTYTHPSSSLSALHAEVPSSTKKTGESSTLNRRTFLTKSVLIPVLVTAGNIIGSGLPQKSVAEDVVDDLAMPTEEEQQSKAKAEMEERIRKKLELQKKASKPATFAESLQREKEKKAELAKTKEEKRNALCEELGRGC